MVGKEYQDWIATAQKKARLIWQLQHVAFENVHVIMAHVQFMVGNSSQHEDKVYD